MLGVFTDQAYNLILLAEDEARMLGRALVEPKHLLLALTRNGNVESLLAERGISATDIYCSIARTDGIGQDLVLGRVPRSRDTDDALERAVDTAAARGVLGPSSEHVLLGLRDDANVARILRELGIDDVEHFVDSRYPASRPPVNVEQVKSYAVRVGTSRLPPNPGPIPPVFERFTIASRSAVARGERSATDLEHAYVEPFHLLLGLLRTEDSLSAEVLRRHIDVNDVTKRVLLFGPGRSNQATGIFNGEARQIVARDALKHAYRRRHASVGTGHILLATLDTDGVISRILGEGPVAERIAAEVTDAIPGDEDSEICA